MPWTCKQCGAEVARDDHRECPGCGAAKTDWTLLADKTREFRVVVASLRVERGHDEETYPPPDDPRQTGPREVATVAPTLPRACARRIAEQGHLPLSRHTLWVRVPGKAPKAAALTLSIEHATAEVVDLELEAPPAPDGQGAELRLLLVHGPGEPLPPDAFPGVRVVDVGDPASPGHAPHVSLALGRKKPTRLPVEVGLCAECGWIAVALLDASGTAPLARVPVSLEAPELGRLELESDDGGLVLVPGVPFADHDLRVGEDLVAAPAVPTPASPHRRHVPHARRGFTRLQVRDPDGFPLDDAEVELVAPDGAAHRLRTDGDGHVQTVLALAPGAHRVRAAGAKAEVELPTSPRDLVIVRLAAT